MGRTSGTLDSWRDYFRTANSDIFDIIHHAIIVAASDCPKDFRLRRDRIAEALFSSKLTKCLGCDKVELAVPGGDDDEEGGCKSGSNIRDEIGGGGGSKESKVNSSKDENDNDHDHDHQVEVEVEEEKDVDKNKTQLNNNNHEQQVSNYSYGEAEALTDELEEQGQIVGEVLRIKELFINYQDETETVLYDSLRKLQLMALSVDTLKATEIGKAVNGIRKHRSKQIRTLARTLIEEWKDMVDDWVNATTAIESNNNKNNTRVDENTPESVNPSDLDYEDGLPSPPMDEAFFATQTTTMELSQFFDGMDDDGNLRENYRKPPVVQRQSIPKWTQPENKGGQEMKKQESAAVVKPVKPMNVGSGRPMMKPSMEQKVGNEAKLLKISDNKATITPKKPLDAAQKDKFKCTDQAAKLEATKRKLHERYQQAENAKRQRTIQVMELSDLPKQGLGSGHKDAHSRPGNHNRQWANGRR